MSEFPYAAVDDPRLGDLTRAMLLVEQSRSEADLARAAVFLAERLAGGRDELKQVFADWLGTLLRQLEGDAGVEPARRNGASRRWR